MKRLVALALALIALAFPVSVSASPITSRGDADLLASTRLVAYDYDGSTGLLTATIEFRCKRAADEGRVHMGVYGTSRGYNQFSAVADIACDGARDRDQATLTIYNLSEIDARAGRRVQLGWFVDQMLLDAEENIVSWHTLDTYRWIRL